MFSPGEETDLCTVSEYSTRRKRVRNRQIYVTREESTGANHIPSPLLERLLKQNQNAGKVPHKHREVHIQLFSCCGSDVEKPNTHTHRYIYIERMYKYGGGQGKCE